MIEAEFHANWISPGGEEMDITPKPNGISRILFLPDSARTYDYRRDHYRIDNIRRPLADDPLVTEYIKACEGKEGGCPGDLERHARPEHQASLHHVVRQDAERGAAAGDGLQHSDPGRFP